MAGQLAGKRCLIVGGTGGIGRATVRRFLAEGARVVAAGLPDDGLQRAGAELADVGGALVADCDATDETQVQALFVRTVQALDGLDVLCHIAGASGRKYGDGPLHCCTVEAWDRTLRDNLTSVFLTNRAAVQSFREQGGGVILNLASVLALSPVPRYFDAAAYTAAKGAILSLSRLVAARYASERIRVNVLAPGLVDTPMAARPLGDPAICSYLREKQPLAGGALSPAA